MPLWPPCESPAVWMSEKKALENKAYGTLSPHIPPTCSPLFCALVPGHIMGLITLGIGTTYETGSGTGTTTEGKTKGKLSKPPLPNMMVTRSRRRIAEIVATVKDSNNSKSDQVIQNGALIRTPLNSPVWPCKIWMGHGRWPWTSTDLACNAPVLAAIPDVGCLLGQTNSEWLYGMQLLIWKVCSFIAHQEEGPFLILTVDGAFFVLPQKCVMFPL